MIIIHQESRGITINIAHKQKVCILKHENLEQVGQRNN